MKTHSPKHFAKFKAGIATLALGLAFSGCERDSSHKMNPHVAQPAGPVTPLAIVLAPHAGEGRIDVEIRERQQQVRTGVNPEIALERLGWLFVAKARESFDAGFYKLAEQCALGL